MGKVFEGKLVAAKGVRVALVAARFNHFITAHLVAGAKDALVRHGVDPEAIDEAWVPGSFELPVVAARFARSDKYHAVVCLGAVIRGATPHFEYVSAEAAKGVARVAAESGKPVIFGILTTDTIEQAVERAGTKAGNKGWEAATAALEMIDLLRQLP